MTEIKPGMLGLTVIGGNLGKLIKFGQKIVDRRNDTYTHAFLVIGNGDKVIEAEPGGAQIVSIDKYLNRTDVLFSDLPIQLEVQKAVAGWEKVGYSFPESDAPGTYENILRNRVTLFGEQCEGVPYNFLDYFALALERFNIHIKAVQDRVGREDRMICSQLVDWCFSQVGIHLFEDGRLPQDVTPGDLEFWIHEHS